MWFAVQAAMQVAGAVAQYKGDKAQAKAAQRMQDYRNKMLSISNAMNQNSITTNTSLAIQQSARQAVYMRRDELSTLGSTAVSAAAAGVKGRSVNATLLDVQRNAGYAERQRSEDLELQFLQYDQERLNSSLSATMQTDLSYIPKPKLSSYLIKAAGNIASQKAGM